MDNKLTVLPYLRRWQKNFKVIQCHPLYRKHVHPVVQFVWDLFPFKLFCWDIANFLNIVTCPFCCPFWFCFQGFAIFYNAFFVIFLPCNFLSTIINFANFIILGPPALVLTFCYKIIEGYLIFFTTVFVGVPAYGAMIYFWNSYSRSFF